MTKFDVMRNMEERGMPSRPFFYPLSSLPAYPGFEARYREKNPLAYDVSSRGINLSCAMNLTDDQIDAQCDALRSILREKRKGA